MKTVISKDELIAFTIGMIKVYRNQSDEDFVEHETFGNSEIIDYSTEFFGELGSDFYTQYLPNFYTFKKEKGIVLKDWLLDAIATITPLDVTEMSSYWNLCDIIAGINTINKLQVTCQRCGWSWVPRTPNPRTCPNPECHSTAWNKPRTESTPGPKPKNRV